MNPQMRPESGEETPERHLTSMKIWNRAQSDLEPHVTPDPHLDNDHSPFAPDFEGSAAATDRISELTCYHAAKSIFFTPDRSLQRLRQRALEDGKKILLATQGLRRGFLILDPDKLSHDQLELASYSDGFENPALGRHVTLARLQEESVVLDLFVTGSWVLNSQGVSLWSGNDVSRLSWLILADRGILNPDTPVVSSVHDCQIVDGHSRDNDTEAECTSQAMDLQYDFIATPERLIRIESGKKPAKDSSWLDQVSDELFHIMPPLQELKGVKLMESIMSGMKQESLPSKQVPVGLTPEAQMGMDIVNRLMKGYKA